MLNEYKYRLSIVVAVVLTLLIVSCTKPKLPQPDDTISPTEANNPREQSDMESLKRLAAQMSPEDLKALKEMHGTDRISADEIQAWGNRTKFFENNLPLFRPDVDWRTILGATFRTVEPEWSQGFEEVLIRNFFEDKRNGVFVDLGCAWPEHHSTTCYLDRELGWTGIAIDALTEYAPMWEASRPKTKFVNLAVADVSGEIVPFYRNEWIAVSSLYKEKAAARGGKENLMELEVETITLNDLLPMHGITKIDLLSIDIKGAEIAALRGFDIERFLPELVCVETRELETVRAYFTVHGYELIEPYRKADKINYYFRRIEPN